MNLENCKYIPTDIYHKSIWEIKCGIARDTIRLDNSDFSNSELYLTLAMSGLPLPILYATDDKYGKMTIFKGSNIVNGLLKYIDDKKNVEKYRARIEDTRVVIVRIDYCPENNYRIDEIKNLINKI